MDDKALLRAEQQRRILATRMAGSKGGAALPEPPFHLHNVQMIYLMCRFDPEDIARIVPAGLTPSGSGWGVICIYQVKDGWGIAPFGALIMTAELDGLASSDGSPANYMHSGLFSGVAGEVMTKTYNANFRIGWGRVSVTDGRLLAEAGVGSKPLIRITARVAPAMTMPLNGVNRYIGRRPEGGFTSYSLAFSLRGYETSDHRIEYFDGARDAIHVMEPKEIVWSPFCDPIEMAFTPPAILGKSDPDDEKTAANLAAIFSGLGRPAAILSADGTVFGLNREANALLAEARLSLPTSKVDIAGGDATAFSALLKATIARGEQSVSERFLIGGGDVQLVAQAISLGSLAGPDRVLVTFDDPSRPVDRDATPTLQLLGLTQAEARIAALVGAGHSPRETADDLGLSHYTVRSALKIIFDKLRISRQAELAKIVARLAG